MRANSLHTRSTDSLARPGTPPRIAASAAGSGGPAAIARKEPEEPQDAQIVLGDAGRRIADEAHDAGAQVGDAAEVVEHLAGRASSTWR